MKRNRFVCLQLGVRVGDEDVLVGHRAHHERWTLTAVRLRIRLGLEEPEPVDSQASAWKEPPVSFSRGDGPCINR